MRASVLRRTGVRLAITALFAGALTAATGTGPAAATVTLPHYRHIVLAIFENHQQGEVIGNPYAPYLTGLAKQGANFIQSYAIEHPSQPNYLDLFSGSNQGVTDDSCPHTFATDNIAHQFIAAGKRFVGYAEGLPAPGSDVCTSGLYARKHVPWSDFSDLNQTAVTHTYASFPADFTKLPAYSWVVPNLCHDMHNCKVAVGDRWSQAHLDAYAQWAKANNSLLIVTFDEDDRAGGNRITTLFVGAHITPGKYNEHIDHFTVLRTIEDMYGFTPLGGAADRTAITDVFTS